jgi:hypothetical protein
MKLKIILYGVLAAFFFLSSFAIAQPNLDWDVLSSGGTDASSAAFQLDATVGQTATIFTSGGARQVGQGYWNGIPTGCCIGNRGDCNNDGTDANILDLNFLVNRVFRGGPPPVCAEEGDCNSDGTSANILDLNFLVNRVFRGGPAPGPC